MKFRNGNRWEAFRDATKTRSDGFQAHVEENHRGGRAESDQDRARYFLGVLQAENHHPDRKDANGGGWHGVRLPTLGKRLDAMKQAAPDVLHPQTAEAA